MSITIIRGGGSGTVYFAPPTMRLTAESGVPISTTDKTSQGTLYWTHFNGGIATYYTGSVWAIKAQSELSLSLTVTSGKNYDVFYNGTALSLSTAWTTDTARADALGTQDGVVVNSADHTKLWIGVIRASGSNVIEDSNALRGIGNAYNLARRSLSKAAGSSSHSYNSATWRSYNADATQRVAAVLAIPTIADGSPTSVFSSVLATARIGLGFDSTTSPSIQQVVSGTTIPYLPPWGALGVPEGYHFFQLIQSVDSSTATYDFGGISGTIFS